MTHHLSTRISRPLRILVLISLLTGLAPVAPAPALAAHVHEEDVVLMVDTEPMEQEGDSNVAGLPSLVMDAQPSVARPGQEIAYVLELTTGIDLSAVTVASPLPTGVVYVMDSVSGGGQYDASTKTLTWSLRDVPAGGVARLSFQAHVTGPPFGEIMNRATATIAGYAEALEAVTGVRVLLPIAEALVSANEGGVLTAADGRVRVDFPAQAVDGIVVVRHVPHIEAQHGLLITFDLEAQNPIDGSQVTAFAKPVQVTVQYTAEDEAWLLARSAVMPFSPTLLYLHPETQVWEPVPGQLDQERRTFTASLSHFSTYAFGNAAGFQPDIMPTVKDFQVDQFTGNATYSLPLYVPPGAGGLQPDLVLRYSSGAIADAWLAEQKNGKLNATSQPGWVGQGWSLDFGHITRDTQGAPTDNSVHRYVLTMAGVSGRLVAISSNEYRLERDPSWRVRWDWGQDNGVWTVWAPDGTKHTFNQRAQYVVWETASTACGYQPKHKTYRWYLTEIQDTSGNQVRFTYNEIREALSYGSSCASDYTAAVYPRKIEYGPLNPSQGQHSPKVVIDFVERQSRSDYNPNWATDTGGQERYYRERLRRIDILVNGSLARRYILEYFPTAWPPEGGSPAGTQWLTLQRVRTIGRDTVSELPALTFSYGTAYSNDSSTTVRALLTQADNGYGAKLRFTYQYFSAGWCHRDPCGHVYRHRVTQRVLEDGRGNVQRSGFIYNGATGNIERQEFWGHQAAVETIYTDAWVTAVAKTATTFHQAEDAMWDPPPRLGYTKNISRQTGGGTELRRADYLWGWAELYHGVYSVSLVESNEQDGVERRRRTAYMNDDYGNPVVELSYGLHLAAVPTVGNWGFEGESAPWNLSPWTTYMGFNASNSEGGRRVGKLVLQGSSSGGVEQDVSGLVSGKTYEIMAWVRATSGATAKVHLWANDTQGGNGTGTPAATPGQQWEMLRILFTATSTQKVRIGLHYTSGSGTIYVDNVRLREVDNSGDERTIHRRFNPNTSAWIVNRVARETVYAGIRASDDHTNLVTRTRYRYDGQSCASSAPSQGQITALDRWNGGSGAADDCNLTAFHTTTYSYDGNGNLHKVTDANGRTTTTTYDSAYRAFPVQITYPTVNTLTMSESYTYDYIVGKVSTATDVNGVNTSYIYDPFGRLHKQIRVGDTVDRPTLLVAYTDANPYRVWVRYRETSNTDEMLHAYYFYNGLGQPIQTKIEAPGNQQTVQHTVYDNRGLVQNEYLPYFVPESPDWVGVDLNRPKTTYEYDALERLTRVTHPDGKAIRTFYQNWDKAVINENNRQKIYEYDAYGRLTKVKDYSGTYTGSPGWGDTPAGQTSYVYNVADWLTKVTAPDNTVTTMSYDPLGRKTSISDPNMGVWSYAYDKVDNLTRQTDARNQTLCFYYDALNRLTGKHYRSDTSCPGSPSLQVTYSYDATSSDGVTNYGKGRRTGMSDSSGSTTWVYGQRGKLVREIKTISGTGGGTFRTHWTYDTMGRMRSMTYPGGSAGEQGEVVNFTYEVNGRLKTVIGSSTYVGNTVYHQWGQVETRNLGGSTPVVRQRYTYNNRGWLTKLEAGNNASSYNNRQNISYSYDNVGNITAISDSAAVGGSQTQSFGYDFLNRLISAQALDGTNGTYGPFTYQYSNAGNITSFQGVGYTYQDAAHKHGVTHLGGVQRYWYDANGNVTRRVNAGHDVTLQYDAENRLTVVSGTVTASYVYDGDGQRVRATVDGVTTVFIGDHYEVQGGTVKQYYYADGVRVAENSGGTLYWLLTDHLGGTNVTLNSSGNYATELRYHPYGTMRYNPGGQVTSYRYTGQRWDSGTGLYWYRSRWYDPAIGRFIQPDTLVPGPGNPQALNRYAYVLNNPVRYNDPTGHCPWCVAIAAAAASVVANTAADVLIDYGVAHATGQGFDLWDSLKVNAGINIATLGVVSTAAKLRHLRHLNTLITAAKHGGDVAHLAQVAARLKPFAGASPEVWRGVESLARRAEHPNIPEKFRLGFAAQLDRAEYYYRRGELQAVEFLEGANRYDLVLVTNQVVEVKYWRQSYAADPQSVAKLADQLTRFRSSGRSIKLEFVQTRTDPINPAFLTQLLTRLQEHSIDLSRLTIEIVPQ